MSSIFSAMRLKTKMWRRTIPHCIKDNIELNAPLKRSSMGFAFEDLG